MAKAATGPAADSTSSRSAKKRNSLKGNRTRDGEVIDAAVKLFYEKGYASTSIQEIADELGMLKGSLYYYIDTKETLLQRIFESSHAQMLMLTEQHRHGDAPAIDRFRAFLRSYAMWYMNNIPRASLYEREWRHASPELRELMLVQRRHYDSAFRELITEVRADAGAANSDIAIVATFITTAVSSLPDWFRPNGNRPDHEVADLFLHYSERVVLGTEGPRS